MLLVYGAGLKIVSGERIWTEVKKTLAGNYAGELFLTMLAVGIGRITSNTSHLPGFRNRIKHIFQMTVDGKISELFQAVFKTHFPDHCCGSVSEIFFPDLILITLPGL